MSMSEFEEQRDFEEEDIAPCPPGDHALPDDFTNEDKAFAQELGTLFYPQNEELPPYYVQTLLEAEDPRFQPPEFGFEHRMRARVFRRLELRHQLSQCERATFRSALTTIPARRSLTIVATFLVVLCLTVIFTAPSFASGVEILLRGGHTGVLQAHSYPKVKPNNENNTLAEIRQIEQRSPTQMSLPAADQQLDGWHIYWPQFVPNNYVLSNVYLYHEPRQKWLDGKFIELDYSLSGSTPKGTGKLVIREFKLMPDIKVLQVVKDGAAQPISVDKNGQAREIYVDGQWVTNIMRNQLYPIWQNGQRSELIYQRGGIVFWIVGDLRDGFNEPVLNSIATSLHPLATSQVLHMGMSMGMGMGMDNGLNQVMVTPRAGEINGPFADDVVAVYPYGSLTPYLTPVGNGPSAQSQNQNQNQSNAKMGGPHATSSP
ncbi:MAG: hypothetical protein WCD86_18335 [Ktedonobacteraceae bacterium]